MVNFNLIIDVNEIIKILQLLFVSQENRFIRCNLLKLMISIIKDKYL